MTAERMDQINSRLLSRQRAYADYLLAHYLVDVDPEIAPDDGMFAGDLDHYRMVGLSALHCIDLGLRAAGRTPADVRRVLDLPCGHGRVLRALRAVFGEQEIVACDLDRAGVDFCARAFGATPVYSSADVDAIELPGEFDLIWVGSLFTHLEAEAWDRFLALFESVLGPGGVMVFTVGGALVAELIRAGQLGGVSRAEADRLLGSWDREGFGYASYDAPGAQEYGRAVADPAWVLRRLAARRDLRLIGYTERVWDCRQDAVAVLREPSP